MSFDQKVLGCDSQCHWFRKQPVEDSEATIRYIFIPIHQLVGPSGEVITGGPRTTYILKAYQEMDVCLILSDKVVGNYTDEERGKTLGFFIGNKSLKECSCLRIDAA